MRAVVVNSIGMELIEISAGKFTTPRSPGDMMLRARRLHCTDFIRTELMKPWLLFIAFSMAAVATANDDAPYAKSGGAGMRGAGFTYAKQMFPKVMKDPASTTFDWESVTSDHKLDTKDKETGEEISIYCVKGVLRSKNSFNAVVPSEWCIFVVEREKTNEMAIAMLDGKVIGKTAMGGRLMVFFDQIVEAKKEKERELAMARNAEAKQNEKARNDGYEAGNVHAAKIGNRAKSLSDSAITRRAKKLAADAGYRDDGLIAQFVEGYADAIASVAQ